MCVCACMCDSCHGSHSMYVSCASGAVQLDYPFCPWEVSKAKAKMVLVTIAMVLATGQELFLSRLPTMSPQR